MNSSAAEDGGLKKATVMVTRLGRLIGGGRGGGSIDCSRSSVYALRVERRRRARAANESWFTARFGEWLFDTFARGWNGCSLLSAR